MKIVSAAFPACSVFNFFQEQILLEKRIPDQNLGQILVLICSSHKLEQANHSKLKTFFIGENLFWEMIVKYYDPYLWSERKKADCRQMEQFFFQVHIWIIIPAYSQYQNIRNVLIGNHSEIFGNLRNVDLMNLNIEESLKKSKQTDF